MIVQSAAKTEAMATVAPDGWDDTIEVFFLDGAIYGILAVGGWTPFQVLLIVDIGTCEQDLVAKG